MNHGDHVRLLRDGVPGTGGVWADLGAGSGAFTLALADLVSPTGAIHAVDRDARSLRRNRQAMRARFPEVAVHYQVADIRRPLSLPPLDGIVMANVLHFQSEQAPVVRLLRGYLKPGGRLLLVEYNTTRRSPAVPYPVGLDRWRELARAGGFAGTVLLATRPSRWLGEIYSTLSW